MQMRCSRFASLRTGQSLAFAIAAALTVAMAACPTIGQIPSAAALTAQPVPSKKQQNRHPAEKDTVQPSVVIPVGPLGFAPPAPFYLGDRFAQVSLDFLTEDSLLFTFRVPGLMAREPAAPGQPNQDQRHIRALTLSLPDGKVTAESLWVLHDYSRYLWMLKDGRFLLRDKNTLQLGDDSLHLEPYLRFPGPVANIEFDPDQEMLVADTTEPLPADAKADPEQDSSGVASQPSTASASVSMNGHLNLDGQKAQDIVRIFSMNNRKVMLFSRTNGMVHLPVDGEGYYEALRGNDSKWMITYQYFKGATVPIGWVDSTCNPALDALAQGIVLASACTNTGARHLTALVRDRDKDHARLWDLSLSPTRIWPLLTASADGLRVARATLDVSHPVGPFNPLDDSDIRGQTVQVYDLASGQVQLTVPASPILDGGGNFALSPSGKRFAVLNQGAIQVFDLPAPAPIPASSAKSDPARLQSSKP